MTPPPSQRKSPPSLAGWWRARSSAKPAVVSPEKALSELTMVAQQTRHMFLFYDAEGRLEWANPAFEEITGHLLADVVGQHPREFLRSPDSDSDTARHMEQAIAEGRPVRAELLNQTRDGRRFWVEIDAHPLFDARRKRLGHVTIATDITDQVNLRARLRTVFDNVACGLLIYDSSGYIIDGNPEAQQLLGQPRERLLDMWLDHPGVQLLDEHGQALPPERHPVMRTVREGQGLRDLVVGHTGADGAVRWLLMHTQRYAPDDLSQPGVIVSLIDITQRREHEQTLRVARDEARDALAQVHGYQQALDTHAGVIVTDAQGHIGSANARFCEQCGYAEHELLGQNPSLLRSELNPPGYFTDLWNTIASGDPWSGEICNRAKDGSLYWVEVTVVPIRDAAGEIARYVSISSDISSFKQTLRQLRDSRERFRGLLAMSSDWYFEQDAQLRFTFISEGVAHSGLDRMAMVGKRLWDLEGAAGGGEDAATLRETLQARQAYRNLELRLAHPREAGRWIWLLLSAQPLTDSEGGMFQGYRGVARDVSERRNAQDALWKLANIDAATGLPNRNRLTSALDDIVVQSRAEQATFTLVCIDVDHFKEINDAHGHDTGDAVLTLIASRLSRVLQPRDVLARVGGDEFVAVLRSASDTASAGLALEALMRAMREPVVTAGRTLGITLSMGVAFFPADADDGPALLKNAGIALHRAKAGGRSQYALFRPELRDAAEQHATLRQEIEAALRAGALLLHYQPVVDVERHRLVGLEALLRWQHPRDGLVSAGRFPQIFSNSDVSARLGRYVMETALEQAASWRAPGLPFGKVCINVTTPDFVLGQFPRELARLIAQLSLPPAMVCIEVTEDMFLGRSAETVMEGIADLHALGVETAFDDFGTGYASLTHLKMPIDRLKIDKTFIHNIEHDDADRAIVGAIAALGQSLGKRITVEGVENAAQLDILRQMGCHDIQGNYLSLPLAATEVSAFILRLGAMRHW